jgi:hypothetical protein
VQSQEKLDLQLVILDKLDVMPEWVGPLNTPELRNLLSIAWSASLGPSGKLVRLHMGMEQGHLKLQQCYVSLLRTRSLSWR